jgi:hypothetical protein
MDDTGFFYCMAPDRTIALARSKEIRIKTANHTESDEKCDR